MHRLVSLAASVLMALAIPLLIALYATVLFPALDLAAGRVNVETADAHPKPKPMWTRGVAPCFFIGRPDVFTEKACGGGAEAREQRWHIYCEPDPDCLQFPDGTSYAEEPAR